MFPAPASEPVSAVEPAPGELVPLSHLALDLPEPVEGWAAFLGRRAIVIRPDSLGRDSVTASAARLLLDEQRDLELKTRRRLALVEQQAIEADEQRRAQLWKGVSATAIPEGMTATEAMLSAAQADRPRRRSPLEEAFDGESMTHHSLADEAS